ncbi:MAG TPA: hypothetical protein VN721_14310 [Flavipsychrobacter sp.]|nr:hypothetical protein [Flavipsychrobacter sp.]
MQKFISILFIAVTSLCINSSFAQLADLKVVIIRHAEKPAKGDNLTYQGLNRSMQLPKVLYKKFGKPDYTYIPSMAMDTNTKHSRMFQTVIPMAVKYNLVLNSKHDEKDYAGIAEDIKSKKGTVLMVWEHKAIAPIVAALGVAESGLIWPDDDYDSIWIITFQNGKATLTKDKENLKPSANCTY